MTATSHSEPAVKATTAEQRLAIVAFVLFLLQDPIVKAFEFATGQSDVLDARILAIAVIYGPLTLSFAIRLLQGRALRLLPFVLTYGFIAFAFALTLAIHPEYETVMFDMEWSYNVVDSVFSPLAPIWIVLFITQLRDPDLIFKALQLFAYANTIYGLIRFAQFLSRGYWIAYAHTGAEIQSGYSLGFGYDMLFSGLILAAFAMRRSRPWLHGGLAALTMGLILVAGSRASLAIGVLGIGVLAFFHGRAYIVRSKLAPVVVTLAIATFAFCALRFDLVIRWTEGLLSTIGVSSRSVDAIVTGDFGDGNGRDNIHDLAHALIQESPLVGHGYYGDRVAIRDSFWWGYPHSILLELQITFGAITGVLILIALTGWVAYAFASAPRDGTRDLMVLFVVQTSQLAVSNSYLYSSAFWAAIALGYLAFSRRRELLRTSSSSAAGAEARPSLI